VIKGISIFLEDHLVPSTTIHGVLLEVHGIGVLLIGPSGVGKSEAALDLITRGHSLVADDKVAVKRYPNNELVGFAEESLRHHMELRGIGIINVQDLFGLASVRERSVIDLVIELQHWKEGQTYDRLGLDETVYHVLDTPVPYILMPVALGRNTSILVEPQKPPLSGSGWCSSPGSPARARASSPSAWRTSATTRWTTCRWRCSPSS
jgi:HPr kinase/phosphorylase